MRKWFAVGLFCLCVLFYYGINNYGVNSKHQSALNEGADVTLLARPRSVGRLASEVVLPVKEDASFPDHVDIDYIEVSRITDQAPVSAGEHLDPDADPGMFYSARSSQQKNVGLFLDIDGEPGDLTLSEVLPVKNVGLFLDVDAGLNEQSSSEIPAPQNVGVFLDVDGNGSDSHFVVIDESKGINIGEFMDPDG